MSGSRQQDHWLARPETIRLLQKIFAVVLVLVVISQIVVSVKGYFGVDGWFAFGAIFGFVSCLAMVLIAKALGFILKRPQNYYDDGGGSDA